MTLLARKKSQARLHASQSDYFLDTYALVDTRHVLQPMSPPQKKLRERQQAMQALISGPNYASTSTLSSTSMTSPESSTKSFGKKIKSLTWSTKKALQPSSSAPLPSPALSKATSLEPPLTPTLRQPNSPMSPGSPYGVDEIRQSTLAAFPEPPAKAAAPRHAFQPSGSVSSVSTHKTTSSFASSSLFLHTDDEGTMSEATSFSCNSSPSSNGRMWHVKGSSQSGKAGLNAVQEEDEEIESRRNSRRNSTPVPGVVAVMLGGAAPETPPRPKRWSASSTKPAADSPPFDPRREQSARRQARSSGTSDSIDADDEQDSPTCGRRRPGNSSGATGAFNGPRWQAGAASNVRIPSMQFDGLALDQAFAEIGQRVRGSPRRRPGAENQKTSRRRTQVLSTYRPASSLGQADNVALRSPTKVEGHTLTLSMSDLESLRGASPEPIVLCRRSPSPAAGNAETGHVESVKASAPRRTTARPAPVDVELANLTFFGPVADPPRSRSPSSRSPRARSPAVDEVKTPTPLLSPLTARMPAANSPKLGEPFRMGPVGGCSSSPRASPTPTSPIPRISVFAPNSHHAEPESEQSSPEPLLTTASDRPTSMTVKVVAPKRVVRMSTRAPPRPKKSVLRRPSLPLLKTAAAEQDAPKPRATTPPPPSPSLSVGSSVGLATPTTSVAPVLTKRMSTASSGGSDCEEQLTTLMNRLHQPHTPPAPRRYGGARTNVASPTLPPMPVPVAKALARDASEESLARESDVRPRIMVTSVDDSHNEDQSDESDYGDEEDEDERKRLTILREQDAEDARRSMDDRQRLDAIAAMMMEAAAANGRWTPSPVPSDDGDEDGAGDSPIDRQLAVDAPRRVSGPVAPAPPSFASRPLSAVFEEEDELDELAPVVLPELDEEDLDEAESPSSSSLSEHSDDERTPFDPSCTPRLAPAAIIVDPIEKEINATLASIESHPSFRTSPVSSSSSVTQSDSFNSSRSSIAYLIESPPRPVRRASFASPKSGHSVSRPPSTSASPSQYVPSRPQLRLVHSRTLSSDLCSILSSASSSDAHSLVAGSFTSSGSSGASGSDLDGSELGVVMMGQRVSCSYDVGVIGVAM